MPVTIVANAPEAAYDFPVCPLCVDIHSVIKGRDDILRCKHCGYIIDMSSNPTLGDIVYLMSLPGTGRYIPLFIDDLYGGPVYVKKD